MSKSKRAYEPVMYKGKKITFEYEMGRVWAKIPSVSKLPLGCGDTKAAALRAAKKEMNLYKM